MGSANDNGGDDKMIVQLTLGELRTVIRAEVEQAMSGQSSSASGETYVSSDVLEKHFGISRATVHNWVHSEGCPHEMRGKILRFKMTAVEAWFGGREERRVRRVR